MIYTIPIMLFGFVWLITRAIPVAGTPMLGRGLYGIPFLVIVAMVLHCGIIGIVEAVNASASTGAPWWTMLLIVGVLYILGAVLSYIPYAIYRRVKKYNNKNEDTRPRFCYNSSSKSMQISSSTGACIRSATVCPSSGISFLR